MIETGQRISNYFQRFRSFTNTDQLSGFYRIRRDIYHFTIHSDMFVAYHLTGSSTSRSNSQTENYIVKTAFEQLNKNFTGNTFSCFSFLKQIAELFFQNSISILSLLFLTKLNSIFRSLSFSRISMLSGRIILFGQNFVSSKNTFTEFTGDS